MDTRKGKRKPETNLPYLIGAKLQALIEEAVIDAYGEDEQAGGFFTMLPGYQL